jgi:hypothetical protein
MISRREFNRFGAAFGLTLPTISAMNEIVSNAAALAAGVDAAGKGPARTVKFPNGTIVPALGQGSWNLGGTTRVGAAEKSQLEKLGLRVIDASAEGWGLINHDLFLSNAQIRLVIRRAVDGLPLDHS